MYIQDGFKLSNMIIFLIHRIDDLNDEISQNIVNMIILLPKRSQNN